MKINNKIVLEGKNGRPIICDLRFNETGEKQPLIIFCHGFKGYKDWGHFNYDGYKNISRYIIENSNSN